MLIKKSNPPHIKLQKYKNFVVRNSFAKITQRRYANSTPITDFFAEYNILEFSALCLHKIYLL